MRQLKTFMRNRKKEMLACGPCECRTLQCWRYANENCGCGESQASLPNYVKVLEDEIRQYWIRLFNEDEEQDNVLKIEEDTDTGGIRLVVGEFLIIKDEDTRALWYGVWDSIDAEAVEILFGRYDEGNTGVGHFTSEAMTQFNAFINNPAEEQADSLKEWLENKAADESPIVIFDGERLPNYVMVEGEGWIQFFDEDEDKYNDISIETDPETGNKQTVVGEFLTIEDEEVNNLWRGVWESLDGEITEKLFGIDEGKEGIGQFIPEAMAQFNTFINNPTEEQADSLHDWLEDRASDEYDPPRHPIVIFDLPILNNVIESTGDRSADTLTDGGENYIGVGIETDAETGKPKLGTYASGVFADERYTIQGTNFWEDLFKSMEIEKVQSMIDNVTEFPENIFTAMNTYYINPTLENAQSLRNLLSSRNPGR